MSSTNQTAQAEPMTPSKYLLCPFCGHRSRQGWTLNKTCKNLSCPANTSPSQRLGFSPLPYGSEARRENSIAPFTKENEELLREYRLEHGERVAVESCQESQGKQERTHLYNRGYASSGPGVGLQALVVPARMMANAIGIRSAKKNAASQQPKNKSENMDEKKT